MNFEFVKIHEDGMFYIQICFGEQVSFFNLIQKIEIDMNERYNFTSEHFPR